MDRVKCRVVAVPGRDDETGKFLLVRWEPIDDALGSVGHLSLERDLVPDLWYSMVIADGKGFGKRLPKGFC
jgi:hypothetical protein